MRLTSVSLIIMKTSTDSQNVSDFSYLKEDNIYFDNPVRKVLASNLQLIQRIVTLAKTYGREIATPREVRQMLGLRMPEEI